MYSVLVCLSLCVVCPLDRCTKKAEPKQPTRARISPYQHVRVSGERFRLRCLQHPWRLAWVERYEEGTHIGGWKFVGTIRSYGTVRPWMEPGEVHTYYCLERELLDWNGWPYRPKSKWDCRYWSIRGIRGRCRGIRQAVFLIHTKSWDFQFN